MARTKQGLLRSALIAATLATFTGVSALTIAPAMAADEAPSNGSIGLRLVDAPVAVKDPRAKMYVVDHLAPGTDIKRRIEVSNTTASKVRVVLYSAAASVVKGSFQGAAAHTPNDLSSWTSVSPGAIDVPAHGKSMAAVSLKVPKDAAPGEQYAAVWAEARSAPASGAGVTQVSRVGIRLYISVGPGGPPKADFTIQSIRPARSPDGMPTVIATVHNTGGRALDMFGTMRLLDGPGGLSAGPFPATLGTTLGIGDTESVSIVLDKQLPAGPWDARISLKSGLLERHDHQSITFPGEASAPHHWLYVALAGLAALLLVCALAFLIQRHRVGARNEATT